MTKAGLLNAVSVFFVIHDAEFNGDGLDVTDWELLECSLVTVGMNPNALRDGKARYPVIGAKVKTGGVPDGRGAELDEIVADSPAQDAGLRKGDIITAVNGTKVSEGIALIVAIRTFQPGQTIEFTIERGSKESKVKVTLDGEDG